VVVVLPREVGRPVQSVGRAWGQVPGRRRRVVGNSGTGVANIRPFHDHLKKITKLN